ncbi:fungal hydrophobin [Lentinus tigrinus ALCF2SS1-7]|uniref:Hydrophobin n=1 Tax=Lentinus tigrinus ALCF2SS1-6 TaxID=1328759 RepID=A0A5C2S3W4_9APHY|nr:fungal hydrophobin [Lentinus tigrinus ALCF2SS1-6]RPD72992.1 fungal hydrophobin [Lentinus tigrinus ALCF2SS1-7]
MFFRVAATALLALPVLAVAAGGSCSTGAVQCCQHLEDANSAAGAALLSAVGIAVQGVTGQLGTQCSPISAVGVGGGSACSANAVCCQNNNVGGLLSVGCIPVQL